MSFDVLSVSDGLGQQELMFDQDYLSLIQQQFKSGRLVFSVCTGVLLCGAAGILKGRLATTHWAAWELLRFYGATPIESRIVVVGNYINCSGVTAGTDGALLVSSLLRGTPAAEEIQLEIEYAPNPIFNSGSPRHASPGVAQAFYSRYGSVRRRREEQARRFAQSTAARMVRREDTDGRETDSIWIQARLQPLFVIAVFSRGVASAIPGVYIQRHPGAPSNSEDGRHRCSKGTS